jgi:hypothetical protein
LQSIMGILKFMSKDQIYTAFRTTYRTTESIDERPSGRLVQQSYLEPHQYKTNASPAEIINTMRYVKSHRHLEPFANVARPAPLWLHTMLTKPLFGRPPIFDKADYANYRRDKKINFQPSLQRGMSTLNRAVIPGKMDRYGGVTVKDSDLLPETEEEFEMRLLESLEQWQAEGARSIQIFFKPPKCHLMNVASKHGFYLHHAHRDDNYILMARWLDKSTEDRLPAYANHYVGVGGIVINDSQEILLIQERRSSG